MCIDRDHFVLREREYITILGMKITKYMRFYEQKVCLDILVKEAWVTIKLSLFYANVANYIYFMKIYTTI